jgi:hypothetical protein
MRSRKVDNDDYEESEEESDTSGVDEYESGNGSESGHDSDTKGSKKRKSSSKKKLPPKKRAKAKTPTKAATPQLGFKSKSHAQQKSQNKKRAHKNLKQIMTLENYQDLPPTIPTCKMDFRVCTYRFRCQY